MHIKLMIACISSYIHSIATLHAVITIFKIFLQANVLYEQCLDKIPSVFGTPLWETMKKVLKIIEACVKVS